MLHFCSFSSRENESNSIEIFHTSKDLRHRISHTDDNRQVPHTIHVQGLHESAETIHNRDNSLLNLGFQLIERHR